MGPEAVTGSGAGAGAGSREALGVNPSVLLCTSAPLTCFYKGAKGESKSVTSLPPALLFAPERFGEKGGLLQSSEVPGTARYPGRSSAAARSENKSGV